MEIFNPYKGADETRQPDVSKMFVDFYDPLKDRWVNYTYYLTGKRDINTITPMLFIPIIKRAQFDRMRIMDGATLETVREYKLGEYLDVAIPSRSKFFAPGRII